MRPSKIKRSNVCMEDIIVKNYTGNYWLAMAHFSPFHFKKDESTICARCQNDYVKFMLRS